MTHNLALSLAKELIQVDTVNPPGNEAQCVRIMAPLLSQAGFAVTEYEYGPNRTALVAHWGRKDQLPIMFSGHLDTVPLGSQPWARDPFGAAIEGGRLYGRGAADMKGGVATLVASAIHHASTGNDSPLVVVLSPDEEIGCAGVTKLIQDNALPQPRCIFVAEPTGNSPCLGHKGVFWFKALFHGKTAHAAFPHLGDNALVKAATAALLLSNEIERGETHPVMGDLTLVPSRMRSGDNYNSVPDLAELGVDIRSTVNLQNNVILSNITNLLMPFQPEIDVIFDLPPLWTNPDQDIVLQVFSCCDHIRNRKHDQRIATFYTDGGILGPGLGNVPVIILGPGESGMAHQVDEYVRISDLHEGVDIYLEILNRLC
ncbi:M20 family metallopeptidase [Desulfopila sp. IMCC35008]|uniref:M20 family metallopeptidase n=1 Tax=Desulfopila sp. IMCC35008 TaxID=2653858 RepID=UPI0013D4FF9B|nr:M20 family metallopeptidase [Desulfopila sp. IMCC35008]